MARLPRSFFERYAPLVARELLGTRIVRVDGGRRTSGLVVETEAYRGERDPASHAFRGRTRRNEVMFGEAGHAYVYFTMGMHYCLNITTEPKGRPAAVLLRALEPLEGLEYMKRRRGITDARKLASGPGNLTKALGIERSLNGEDIVTSRRVYLEEGVRPRKVVVTTRVGLSRGTTLRWRFYAEGNHSVSKGKPSG